MSNSILAMPYLNPFEGLINTESTVPIMTFNNNSDGHLSTWDPNSPYYIKPLEALPFGDTSNAFGGMLQSGNVSNIPLSSTTSTPTHKRHHHLLPILIIGGIAFMKFKS